MVFSSITFLFYFLPAFLLLYHLLPFRRYKNSIILLASIVFYAWGAPKFIFILLASTIIDFYIVKWMDRTEIKKKKRVLLALSISINLGLLAYFKYANFFIDNVNLILHSLGFHEIAWTKVALPIGISFYTFQTLTYSIDVFRKVHAPLKRLADYLLYIMSFPQMIAGPIVRFNSIADQITERKEKIDDKLLGFFRFCIGLAKKVLIANVMGEQADLLLNGNLDQLSFTSAWVAMLAYTFQIYFDFSGYSDMAIGLGRMMGFTFPENFDSPYTAKSISEFWRRWHMTLGGFMRDYLYIPLGGNRVKTKGRLYFNLWLVFLLSGLWHGASWNFVIWGAYHGFFLILDRLFLLKFLDRIGAWPARIFTFLVVILGWVFFRIELFDDALLVIHKLFDFGDIQSYHSIPSFGFILLLAFFFSFITATGIGMRLERVFYLPQAPKLNYFVSMSLLSILLFALSSVYLLASGFNPFIYFRF